LYQDVLKCVPTLSEDEKSTLKTKLRNTCTKYGEIKIPFQQRETIKRLTNNPDIIIMKQDKGRGVVIMDRNKYTEKCLAFLESDQFKCLTKDPTKTTERKVQNLLRKIKSKLPDNTYRKLYPTGSRPGQFYGLAKIHKLKENEGIDELPLRPIISNIGTATYSLAKHLAKLLSPLATSEYTVPNTEHLVDFLKQQKVPDDCELVSFDVTSLFTSVPLQHTIDIILRKIYDEKLVQTNIPRKEMNDLLLLCTRNVHFTFEGKCYQQLDGVAMGSPLGPVIAGIFMVELENTIVPGLINSLFLSLWKRYVDDTLCFVKKGFREHVLSVLNAYHDNIKFTYEEERNNMISFLDVLLIRNVESIDLAVFRKETNTDLYINWNAFAPETWKISTLKMLIRRAYRISTKDYLLEMELDHIRSTFTNINNFPTKVINRAMREIAQKEKEKLIPAVNITENPEPEPIQDKIIQITLPYAGKKGELIMKEVNKQFKNLQHHKIKGRFAYKAKRLASSFNLKDKIEKKYQHNVVYRVDCPDCDNFYIGESGRRIEERVFDHAGRDRNSHVYKHSLATGHNEISMDNVTIINSNFSNYYKRKVSEAIYIKQKRPILNIQDTSVPLKLLN